MVEEDITDQLKNFHEMELDDRIVKAVAKLGWVQPTLIQEKSIPLIIEGKDVLLRARTGSGKTAAFAIPAIQKILNIKQTKYYQETRILILAPSKELCNQIFNVIKDLTDKCSRDVHCIDISPKVDLNVQKPLLVERPDIIVGTPARVLQHIKAGNLNVSKTLEMLIIDEADLVFSFGYESELKELLKHLPKIYQAVLASATLSADVKSLKSLVLNNPVILKLEEPDIAPSSQLTHYHLAAEEMDKASILYALLKLHLIRGKTIIFVNTVDRCYKLKLYLEQFGIPTCVLNSELPATIRCHSVNQFNQGIYDIIIASDEKSLEQPGDRKVKSSESQKSKRRKDKESGVSRGIDFQFVSNIINFDFPLDVESYIHRAGRTARGNNQGSVLSFVSIKEQPMLNDVENHLRNGSDTSVIKTYQFKLEEIEGFRYRAKDAWRAVTRIAVREARLKEIKQEIFNCQKLKSYFEDNPNDLKVLRHDKALHTVRVQQHLSDVPEYIVPPSLKNLTGLNKRKRKHWENFRPTENSALKYQKKKNNPLVAMEFEGFKKDRNKDKKIKNKKGKVK
ncbi:probable ATP-dependent RNA helicase DDX56 [Agrilus planipennis]|uniref:RNA helicase n=1 Tax=Agrilus planipennis TaxID=224129 RepID=A0A1W4WQ56_AGRPL|nr:probable ATP-dependent RNA helicase DDX56 [Agrilus planipennis]